MQHWQINDWLAAYRSQQFSLEQLYDYVASINNDDNAWISLASKAQLSQQLAYLSDKSVDALPLFGVPFAVKDNIDVAGFVTTAGCPAAQYVATTDATVVAKLKQAGAIVIGKTNLDQFATGLVGVRSPYGAVKNSFNAEYISGGSSSGSSVVVANGIVPFALGTDTAGSGRVPAGHNNIVGLKPTKGWFSNQGLIPACRTQDVISIFALTVADAWTVAQQMQGYDSQDSYSRQHPANTPSHFSKYKIAIPAQLTFYGDKQAELAFKAAIHQVEQQGYTVQPIDFTVFNDLAAALYNDAWVAERTVAVDQIVERAQVHPVINEIISQAQRFDACDAMQAEYNRAKWARKINDVLAEFDALMVPTAPTIYRIAEVEADPITKNSHMGAYTNFVNLADLSALALPNTIRDDGLPSGVTFIAKAWHDQALANFGAQWQAHMNLPLGNSQRYPTLQPKQMAALADTSVLLAVVGAHLSGMPLNFQLTRRGGVLLERTHTAAEYKLYALEGTQPAKPALEHVSSAAGHRIVVEVWQIPLANFGAIVAEIPPPLGIGSIKLEDNRLVKGFICEPYGLANATDISDYGGWRAYQQALVASA